MSFAKGINVSTILIIGGEKEQDQINKIKNEKPNIIIGTPGRILHLVKKKELNLNNNQVFVIDECDKMLSALGKIIIYI
jgi:superfamily II DNA/RNA helicase